MPCLRENDEEVTVPLAWASETILPFARIATTLFVQVLRRGDKKMLLAHSKTLVSPLICIENLVLRCRYYVNFNRNLSLFVADRAVI